MKKYRIEFGEIKFGDTARKNLLDVWESNWASAGPKVAEFENEWGKLFGYKFNKAVSSGTDADINACLCLYDLGAKEGDEIIVPALSFIATANSVLAAGFKPVFVDIEKETLNINPLKIEEKITSKTRAVMAVSTMGKPPEMNILRHICKQHNLIFILDNCEGHGCMFKGQYAGRFADVSTYSFYAAHLICSGEGGMVSTNRQDIDDIVNSTRSHGRLNGELYFDHVRRGLNSKMNDLEASLGLEGIETFAETFYKRKSNLNKLIDGCASLDEFAWFNREEEYEICCPHAFSITLKNPKFNYRKLYDYLEQNGVKTKRNFGSIPTQHKAYSFMGHKLGDFPEAEYVGNNGMHIGVHQYLQEDDINYVIELIHTYFRKHV
jgi:dTDP-4-amino-4,6-dideoxygalactose transaminase